MKLRALVATALSLSACAVACSGTTGYGLVSFKAAATGASDAKPGVPYELTNDRGFHVVLTRAKMHVGAIYLDQSLATSGSAETRCTLPGTYTAQVRSGLDVDLLSPEIQPFPELGSGSTLPSRVAEVWLTGGDVNALDDDTVVLDVAGTADRAGQIYPFSGQVTIGQNRAGSDVGGALPGAHPLCKQRIVSPILASITSADGGLLVLHLDPKALFTNVDFSQLAKTSDAPPAYAFSDTIEDQPSINLYQNLRAAGPLYRFDWIAP
ncbi:MAG: hypothetical protein ABIP89_01645 [Polyangiaceae bacterium]